MLGKFAVMLCRKKASSMTEESRMENKTTVSLVHFDGGSVVVAGAMTR